MVREDMTTFQEVDYGIQKSNQEVFVDRANRRSYTRKRASSQKPFLPVIRCTLGPMRSGNVVRSECEASSRAPRRTTELVWPFFSVLPQPAEHLSSTTTKPGVPSRIIGTDNPPPAMKSCTTYGMGTFSTKGRNSTNHFVHLKNLVMQYVSQVVWG